MHSTVHHRQRIVNKMLISFNKSYMDLFPLEPKNCDAFGENLGHMGSQGRTGIPCVGTAHATRLLHGPRNKDQVCEMNVMLSALCARDSEVFIIHLPLCVGC